MRLPTNPVVLAILGVPAWLYGAVVRLRMRLYARARAIRRAPLPVISVGNLTLGGTGKTPIVAWLVGQLQERGHRPAVVSRGYRGRAGRGPLLVSDGSGPRVDAAQCGDEPFLLAQKLRGAIVVVGSDRVRATTAARQAGADVVVLDDGFQHLRLHRELDVVLLDAHSPFGNYRLLPAGTLREPASGLSRADLVIITRSRPDEDFVVLHRVIRRYHPTVPILRAAHRRSGFVDRRGAPVPRPRRVVAFCAIGNPDAFVADLESEGLRLAAFRTFRDHHAYSDADWARLVELARRHDATLLTTEKDLVRLPTGTADDGSVCALRIEAVVHEAERLLSHVERAIGHAGNPRP